ncbi:MAG: SRPBCC family protein [Solirubrobacterales bacterium]|nr:SRPBCC family protein [Solirubrobacterales bacterium]OJU96187.1 MAG: hypothetical protein BGO23_01315 [Solirubrobacterales bacterium 67-14]
MSDGGDAAAFAFVSRWELSAPREAVWDALVDFNNWPRWWPALEKVVETIHGGPDGIGQKATAAWRGPFGYSLNMEIEAVERIHPDYLRGVAAGDVEGEGVWRLGDGGDGWTSIEFDWNVRATKRWMVALAPVARPLFVSGHDHVMKEGAQGLANHLSCDLRDFSASAD